MAWIKWWNICLGNRRLLRSNPSTTKEKERQRGRDREKERERDIESAGGGREEDPG
jgi:hypothetical protein